MLVLFERTLHSFSVGRPLRMDEKVKSMIAATSVLSGTEGRREPGMGPACSTSGHVFTEAVATFN